MMSKQSSAIQNKWAVDPKCVLLLHGDGANNGTIFVDSSHSPKITTPHGNAKTVNTVKRLGNASMYFDGVSGTYITLPSSSDWDIGSNDFTVSVWAKRTRIGTEEHILALQADASAHTTLRIDFESNNNVIAIFWNTGLTQYVITIGAISDYNWHQIVYGRSGNNLFGYLDGVAATPTTISGTSVFSSSYNLIIGSRFDKTLYFNGYIDEFTIWKGIALPITSLYPQRSPLYDYALSEPAGV